MILKNVHACHLTHLLIANPIFWSFVLSLKSYLLPSITLSGELLLVMMKLSIFLSISFSMVASFIKLPPYNDCWRFKWVLLMFLLSIVSLTLNRFSISKLVATPSWTTFLAIRRIVILIKLQTIAPLGRSDHLVINVILFILFKNKALIQGITKEKQE